MAPAQVKQAAVARWNLDPASVFAGDRAEWRAYSDAWPTVWIVAGDRPASQFDTEFNAGKAFAEEIGRPTELEVATMLCRDLGTRAVVDEGGQASDVWYLVTSDGWHGRVVADDDALDEGVFTIAYALQQVPSEPEIEVRDPPDWQHGWYDDGKVPESGYLEAPHRR
ncbi:hypothetical protein [Glycomyces tarimensis]